MTKPKIKLAAICALSALTACRTAHVGPSDGGGTLSAEAQYCVSAGNAGDETVEVLVRNGTGSPVEFVRAELDGTELPESAPSAAKALKAFSFEGVGGKAKSRLSAQSPVAGARWWQFYPSPRIEAGGAAVFQLNFAEKPRPRELRLTEKGGRVLSVTGLGATLREAVDRAYEGVAKISFEGMFFRKDIAHRAFER